MQYGHALGYEEYHEEVEVDSPKAQPATAIADLHRLHISPTTAHMPCMIEVTGKAALGMLHESFGHFEPRTCRSFRYLPDEISDIPLLEDTGQADPLAAEYDNLRALLCSASSRPSSGQRCKIRDVKSRPDLNGTFCSVVKYDEDQRRYHVQLEKLNRKIVALKPVNLSPVLEQGLNLPSPPLSTLELQEAIEAAWAEGYDDQSRAHFGGSLVGKPLETGTCIGASEVLIALWHLRYSAYIVEIIDNATAGDAILALVSRIFDPRFYEPGPRQLADLPIFLQAEGHSMLIIGATTAIDRVLLVADPAEPGCVSTMTNEELNGKEYQLVLCGELQLEGITADELSAVNGQYERSVPNPVLTYDTPHWASRPMWCAGLDNTVRGRCPIAPWLVEVRRDLRVYTVN